MIVSLALSLSHKLGKRVLEDRVEDDQHAHLYSESHVYTGLVLEGSGVDMGMDESHRR